MTDPRSSHPLLPLVGHRRTLRPFLRIAYTRRWRICQCCGEPFYRRHNTKFCDATCAEFRRKELHRGYTGKRLEYYRQYHRQHREHRNAKARERFQEHKTELQTKAHAYRQRTVVERKVARDWNVSMREARRMLASGSLPR